MKMLFKELQPIDVYTIRLAQSFSDTDRQLLTLFYQPLIGFEALSLYMTLWADGERTDSVEFNHYHLMNVLSLPLGPIFQARISLEAIGLLRTYRKNEGDHRIFLYELNRPLDAKRFLEDPLLSTFLFSKIGKQAYRSLRNRFVKEDNHDADFEEVSRTFLDVYTPVQPNGAMEPFGTFSYHPTPQFEGVPFHNPQFDYELMIAGLSEQMVPRAAISSVSKSFIEKLAFLYSLTPIDMQKVMMMALDEDLKLSEERLRKAAADYYKVNRSTFPPVLMKNFQTPIQQYDHNDRALSREEELVQYFEQTSPIDMLRDLSGSEPLSVDVQLAERLIHTQGMPVGVVNVLLHYVLIRNDGKITKGFVERIASHWIQKKIQTVKEAMEISRKDHDQYMKWLQEGKPSSPPRKPIREEKVPEWFQTEEKNIEKPKATSKNIEEERQRLLKELGITPK